MTKPVLQLIGFAAPPVLELHRFANLISRDWDCHVALSPTAATWVDLPQLQTAIRKPVQVFGRLPGESRSLPRADAVAALPITFNSINKWAQGLSDNLALGLLNEALGDGTPTVAAIWAKPSLKQHPAYLTSIRTLATPAVSLVNSGDTEIIEFPGSDLAMEAWRSRLKLLISKRR